MQKLHPDGAELFCVQTSHVDHTVLPDGDKLLVLQIDAQQKQISVRKIVHVIRLFRECLVVCGNGTLHLFKDALPLLVAQILDQGHTAKMVRCGLAEVHPATVGKGRFAGLVVDAAHSVAVSGAVIAHPVQGTACHGIIIDHKALHGREVCDARL